MDQPSMRREFLGLLPTAAAGVVVADVYFFRHQLGLNVAAFALLLLLFVAGRVRRWSRPALLVFLVGLAYVFSLALSPSWVGVCLAALALVTLASLRRTTLELGSARLLARFGIFVGSAWLEPLRDLRVMGRVIRQDRARRRALTWIAPVVLASGFLALFSLANPLVEEHIAAWLAALRSHLEAMVTGAAVDRIAIWCGAFALIWALGRHRFEWPDFVARLLARRADHQASWPESAVFDSFVVRCLWLFNLVFAVENVLDARYLWGATALPPGQSYGAYAHRGAYPLIATALLAAGFVLATFRDGCALGQRRGPRLLVLAWVGQNLFLTLSALYRLELYVEAYSLSLLRISAGLWMLLVLHGVGTILWRILVSRSAAWLIDRNVSATLLLLSLVAFLDLRALTAEANVRLCREAGGRATALDIAYLVDLGPSAMPAITHLLDSHQTLPRRAELVAAHARLSAQLDEQLSNWRGWTIYGAWIAASRTPE